MRSFGPLVVLSCLSLSACIVTVNGDGDEDSSDASSATNEAGSSTVTDTGDDTGDTSGGDGDSGTTTGGDGDSGTTTGGDGDSGTTDSTTTGGDGDGGSTDSTTTGGDGDSGTTDSTTTGGDGDGDAACTTEGMAVVAAINAARADNNLPAIPLSPSMCHVAHTHSQDLADNYESFGSNCNLHSWSDQGSWGACCYTPDHAEAQCMWDKPDELTNYTGNGYEISFVTSAMGGGTAQDAVDAWLNSSGHSAVILNEGIWADNTWQAIGGGMVDGYWNVWFGEDVDPGWP
jgi:uncharacterized protein YkwD